MKPRLHARYAARARIVKALAHPTRLFIVDTLAQRPRCVCELTALIGADMSTVSKHLALLKAVGLVVDEKRGLQVWYRLNCACLPGFFKCIETVLKTAAREQLSLVN